MEQVEVTQTVDHSAEPVVESTTQVEYTPVQIKAIEQGWIPKEEFDGDETLFIDAPEFVRRGELFKKIETQSREIKATRQALEALKIHHTKVKEAEYDRALKSLQDARKQAVVEGEHERAFALEEKIDEIKTEKADIVRQAQAQPVQEGYTPEFERWVSNNEWYETSKLMRRTADALGKDFYDEGHSPAEVLRLVEAEIKKEFAHKFLAPVKKGQAVESSTRSPSRSTDASFSMTAEETAIMRQIVNTGIMTEAEYKKELKATRKG